MLNLEVVRRCLYVKTVDCEGAGCNGVHKCMYAKGILHGCRGRENSNVSARASQRDKGRAMARVVWRGCEGGNKKFVRARAAKERSALRIGSVAGEATDRDGVG